LKEVPYPTEQSVLIIFNQIRFLSNKYDHYTIIIDLSEASRPKAKIRRCINDQFVSLANRLVHCSYIATNPLLQVALRFVMFNSGLDSYSIHSKWEDALKTVKSEYEQQCI